VEVSAGYARQLTVSPAVGGRAIRNHADTSSGADDWNGEGEVGGGAPSCHGHNLSHLGDLLAKISLDPMLQGHVAAGASDACAMKADTDLSVFLHVDQLDVPAIGLNCRPDEVDDRLNFVAEGGRIGGR
jgi:hypothetical protein